MKDYSDAPDWATEVFNTGSQKAATRWYYGNEKQYVWRNSGGSLGQICHHTEETLRIISQAGWWREPLNVIRENE